MQFAFVTLILLTNIQGYLTLTYNLTVKCEHENICALRETSVSLKCFYSDINIKTGFWFSQKQRTNWRNKDEPEDLTLDSDYSGRVYQRITEDYSRLTISDVRERDSGEYQLMFIMKDGVKHFSSVTVNLTVTVLQVKIHQESTELKNQRVQLTCNTSCTLTSKPKPIYWRKDGQYVKERESITLETVSSTAYSCSLSPYPKIPSATVCLSNSRCWGVTYTSTRVCALVGSTVDIHSTYSHPTGHTVEKTYWHLPNEKKGNFRDLREKRKFAGRVKYIDNTLKIKDVKMSDSGEYQFRIITNKNSYSGSPGVILTVTGTKVKSSQASVSGKVILSCSTECTLDNNITFSWYKNGHPVTDGVKLYNKLYLDSVSRKELKKYSCAVGDVQSEVPDPEKSMATRISIVLLSVFLIFAVIGVLCYSFLRMKRRSSQKCGNTNPAVQPNSKSDPPALDNSAHLYAVADFPHQTHSEEQIIHYSSIHFKQSHKTTSFTPAVIYASMENVHYATVKSK